MSNMPPPPAPPVQKKGMPAIAWVGIGCGGIIILGIIAGIAVTMWGVGKFKEALKHPGKDAAVAMASSHTLLEKGSENDDTGEMGIKIKPTGEQLTLKYEDLAKGNFKIKAPDGTTIDFANGDVAKVPAWVPRYPGATNELSVVHFESPTEVNGIYTASTSANDEATSKFFESQAKSIGMNSSGSSNLVSGGTSKREAIFKDGKRDLAVRTFAKDGGALTIQIIYIEKK